MKYLVMECHLSHAVVLSDDGKFLNVANLRYEVGQTVEDVVEMQIPEAPAETRVRWLTPLVSLAACLVLVVGLMFFRVPYASVYMTINPEVRIDVNRSDVVVGVEGVNDDGVTLLEGYEFKKKHLDTVMDELVDRAIDMGYLSDGGTVTVTLDADDDWVVSHSDSLGAHLNEYLTEKVTVTIEITGPVHHEAVIPADPGHTDYGDTDYGTEPPTQAAVGTDYGPDHDGVTDHHDTDYGPNNDGVTDYTDDGITDYDAPEDGDDVTDNDGDSGYDKDEEHDSGYDDDSEHDDD